MGIPSQQHELFAGYLQCRFQVDSQLSIQALVERDTGASLLSAPSPLCVLSVDGETGQAAMREASASEVCAAWTGLPGGSELALRIRAEGSSLRFQLEGAGQGRCRIAFPFLQALQLSRDPCRPDRVVEGAQTFRDAAGRPILTRVDFSLPLVRIAPDGRTLTFLPEPADWQPSFDGGALANPEGVVLQLEGGRRRLLQADLVLHDGGWPAAFQLLRERVRRLFDLSQYQRPDTAWYQDQFVQHFTFLYGREILNLETGQFELDRLLDEAERDFGGYDGLLLWGVYPRLGIDERSQWDFYDDFPGGREGLRQLARRARERGVRVFISYQPWDQSGPLHGNPKEPDEEALARLVRDVEADGVFLDTMSAVDPSFRAALDRARPGVVFCSEGKVQPAAFAMITGSWSETTMSGGVRKGNWSGAQEPMPQVDLWRFLFPEHRMFALNRHGMGAERVRMIQRGFFGGMGWVVWQDIFGLAHPYTPGEAALLKRCRTIFREHRLALRSSEPTPLVVTLHPHVLANLFPAEEKRLWTLYNDADQPADGALLQIEPREGVHWVDLWNNREVEVDEAGRLRLALGPRAVGAVAELPRLLSYDPVKDQVQVAKRVPGSSLQLLNPAGHVCSLPAEGKVRLGDRLAGAGAFQILRLLADGELLDQIEIPVRSERGC